MRLLFVHSCAVGKHSNLAKLGICCHLVQNLPRVLTIMIKTSLVICLTVVSITIAAVIESHGRKVSFVRPFDLGWCLNK